METRRTLLKKIGLSTAGLLLVSGLGGGYSLHKSSREDALKAPWWLFEPLTIGSPLAYGWSLMELSRIERGASVLSLSHRSGAQARIHICSHQGHPQGIASSKYLDLLLMDGGDGNTPSDEKLGRVILSLAKHIAKTEEFLEKSNVLSQLEKHEERLIRYQRQGLT